MHRAFAARISIVLFVAAFFAVNAAAQAPRAAKPAEDASAAIRATPAFAELILRRTEVDAELEALLLDYTDEFPKVISLKYEAGLIAREIDRLLAMKASDAPRLTLSLGKLMVKKATADAELWDLLRSFKDGHPDVRRARKRAEIYEKAVADILGK